MGVGTRESQKIASTKGNISSEGESQEDSVRAIFTHISEDDLQTAVNMADLIVKLEE